ncbi:MAG: UDP-glucose 4-epimerase GalE [Clostridia bacterium]|nr:UDP-glucose 4-epimerase GalE [Clostridia bacterium]
MILVTGGAGYVGSHIAAKLSDIGREAVIIDNLACGHKEAARGMKLYQGDLRDAAFLDKVFETEKIDAIIHFAANSLVGESVENPLKYYENNMGGAISLVGAMVRHNVKNIVFSSSAAVYGEPERVPILEDDRKDPTNPYGETKLAIERLLKWCDRAYGIKYAALRYFNVAGARDDINIGEDHSPETHLIPLVIQAAMGKRDKIMIFGDDYKTKDGTCIRDYIDVRDLANAHILALDYLGAGGESEAFNLGYGTGFSVREIIEVTKKVSGVDFKVEIGKRRAGDPALLVASPEKAKKILGFKPEFDDIEKIVASAWRWHSSHPNGF